ncbi:ABC transporter ATP-binding protein/permease [Paenibacillus macquariensis]|uniref:ABC-type lipoprotein export system, ATPase component n=1 Tax=Paenibacillus macquariensis TaxID=948756 RepID=A0ABY1KAJ7_9BACL|nr:ABC transporter ATP-binding protein/permease [Paenibacillus macquariensis]MEC0093683.1 ABC transporter ATP-binding protein/permease [Paenibacillus macquariensis]OAB31635.1 ABC transporter [Paenibacillus macquariensis subsp. macquariensis]SIR50952.1 ABC-type lipoprotein export system, ATPase component [Paenibacillus macquariensis]
MFEIKNVSRVFGQEYALKNISLEIKGGLNFIIGASGSGKTTLLKILSGLDQDFTGEAYYRQQSLKALSTEEKSEYYNKKIGIVWQEFNLIDDLSVFDNIKMPLYLNDAMSDELVMYTMKQLKINELANQKVRNLSGGQKQRVAIARELVKNPEVIIADEPTAALDPKSASIIVNILKQIAKTRTVIIVTHDRSMLDDKSSIYEMDKGEIISTTLKEQGKTITSKKTTNPALSLKRALSVSITNVKSKIGRYAVLALAILVSTSFLLMNTSGSIQNSSQNGFEELYESIGEGLLDVEIAASFISAGGMSGSEDEQKPAVDVNQDIAGLYDKYLKDERVEHVVFAQAVGNIKVVIDGKEHTIETSNNVPVFKKLLAGKMPMGDGNEVVVSSSLGDIVGLSNKELIGKTIDLSGTLFNWDSGQPVEMPVGTTTTIVGVADTTMVVENNGEFKEYPVDDSFFFSKSSVMEMRGQANMASKTSNFSMRAKSPEDMISLKDELLANGIVPNGRFELVEDMVRLNDQAKEQSGSAVIVISVLALVVSLAVSFMTAAMRKKEYAIYKINGYTNSHLTKITLLEYLLVGIAAIVLFLVTSPLINMAMKSFTGSGIVDVTTFAIAGGLIILLSGLCGVVASMVIPTVNMFKSLKSGDR